MKLMISGSRSIFSEAAYNRLSEMIDTCIKTFGPLEEIVHGKCPEGVDVLAQAYAMEHDIPYKHFPAKWRHANGHLDLSAGPRRNRAMAEYADVGVMLWDGESSGTNSAIQAFVQLEKPHYIAYVI